MRTLVMQMVAHLFISFIRVHQLEMRMIISLKSSTNQSSINNQ